MAAGARGREDLLDVNGQGGGGRWRGRRTFLPPPPLILYLSLSFLDPCAVPTEHGTGDFRSRPLHRVDDQTKIYCSSNWNMERESSIPTVIIKVWEG